MALVGHRQVIAIHPSPLRLTWASARRTQTGPAITAAPSSVDSSLPRRMGARLRDALAAAWVAATGLAPHVLHHVGPLAGAAFISGALGTSLFAVVGFVATIPLLLRLRRRFGSWTVPSVALAGFAVIFVISNTVVGSLVLSGDEVERLPVTEEEHLEHHP